MSHETAGAVAEKWRQNDAEGKVIRSDTCGKLPRSLLDGYEAAGLEPKQLDVVRNPSLPGMTGDQS